MIVIKLNDNNFEYDIYSLVKAFYPKEEVVFAQDCSKDNISYFIEVNYLTYDALGVIKCIINKVDKTDMTVVYDNSIKVDYSDRKETKNRLKRLIYQGLSKECNKTLFWGTLTGIRPIKIARRMIEDNIPPDKIAQYMKSTYLSSDIKTDLAIDIAKREVQLFNQYDLDDSYSLYIGIPFCPSRCLYCSFTSYPYDRYTDIVDEYIEALRKELTYISHTLRDKKLTTIYIGGGTPTSLDDIYLSKLLDMISEIVSVDTVAEYNLEAGRADSITESKLDIIKRHNVNRISINPQTMNDKTLKLIGRNHKSDDVIKIFYMARDKGFDNINMDIIVGLLGEDINDFDYTLQKIYDLRPDSLTLHSLSIKRSSNLNIHKEQYENYYIDNSMSHMDMAARYAKRLDMNPYYLYRQKNIAGGLENIGYAKAGKEGLYNVLIMEEMQTIIALGAGASSKYVSNKGLSVSRSENVKEPKLYIDRIDEMIDRKKKRLEEIGWLQD